MCACVGRYVQHWVRSAAIYRSFLVRLLATTPSYVTISITGLLPVTDAMSLQLEKFADFFKKCLSIAAIHRPSKFHFTKQPPQNTIHKVR